MKVVALLRAEQIPRIWSVVSVFGRLSYVDTLSGFRTLLQSQETHLAVVNPAASRDSRRGPLRMSELVSISGRPIPLLLYVAPRDVRAALPLVREGATDLVVFDVDDAPASMRTILDRILTDVPSLVLAQLAPTLEQLPPPIREAVRGLFIGSVSEESAARLAGAVGLGERAVQRHLLRAGFVPIKTLACLARVARAHKFLSDPRMTNDRLGRLAAYASTRALAIDVRRFIGCPLDHVRTRMSSAEFAAQVAAAALRTGSRDARQGRSPT